MSLPEVNDVFKGLSYVLRHLLNVAEVDNEKYGEENFDGEMEEQNLLRLPDIIEVVFQEARRICSL
jgi:hypothetical protein